MKNILSVVSVVLLFSCQGQNKDIIRNVDAIRFNQLIYQKEEGIIIDVRTSREVTLLGQNVDSYLGLEIDCRIMVD